MGALMRAMDWSRTPVGPVAQWPQSLRTAVSILLESGFPMYVAWGPSFTQFYNDSYRPILGSTKHPALGKATSDTFSEIWDLIGPMFHGVLQGKATTVHDFLLPLDRHGFVEECYFVFSYSPVRAESGRVGGVLVTVTETTKRVFAERRLRTLREVASQASVAATMEEAWNLGLAALDRNAHDFPFVAVRPAAAHGPDTTLCGRSDVRAVPWPVQAAQPGEMLEVDVQALAPGISGGPWGDAVGRAVLVQMQGAPGAPPIGTLIAGLSPRQPLDEDYRGFLRAAAEQLGACIAKARAHEQERRRAEALAEIDRAKTAFFSNVSHEFRTPLTLILGPLEELRRGADPRLDAALAPMHRNALRLLRLVNNLLDFSRIEAGRMQADLRPADVSALTADLASSFRSLVESSGLAFEVDCPPGLPQVDIDRVLWEKVVLNLVSNAYKFTLTGGIAVRARADGSGVRIEVRDTGAGIPQEHLGRVFDRFHRVPNVRSRTHEGTGIGLALVRELVQLHGGTVDATSEEGAGSVFTIRLPASTSGAAHVPTDAATAEAGMGDAFVQEAAQWQRVEAPLAPGRGARNGTVLVVDDNADMRAYLARLLQADWTVVTAADGAAGLARARDTRPDLILADIMMPGLDGLGLVEAVRRDQQLRDVPVVFLSARAGEDASAEGLVAGADDYIVKPFTAQELLARVATHVRLSRLRAEARALQTDASRQVQEGLQRSHRILEALQDGVVLYDDDWRFAYINPAAAAFIGTPRDDLLGRVLWDALPGIGDSEFGKAVLATRADGQERQVEATTSVLSGKWFEATYVRVPDGVAAIFRDVTARHRERADLRRQQAELERVVQERTAGLEALNRELDTFNYSVSHDLRAHLRGISAFCGLLRQRHGERLPPDGLQVLDRVVGSCRDLGHVVDSLLRLTQLTRVPLARAQVDVSTLASRHLQRLQGLDASRRVAWTVQEGITAWADPDLMDVVLDNLLSNAWKFTARTRDAAIRVEATATGFLVRDNGAGFDMADASRLFQPFSRLHNDREFEGSGIGLATVARILQRHGGAIAADSRPGAGTTMTVRIHATRADGAA